MNVQSTYKCKIFFSLRAFQKRLETVFNKIYIYQNRAKLTNPDSQIHNNKVQPKLKVKEELSNNNNER